jgi:AcrR family transcriptional regulator
MTFRRARNEEQREVRRQAILSTAEAMLAEMPVAALSLNELSRRVGLAKSNVLRYFESREAVLLELLDAAWREWLEALEFELGGGPSAAPVGDRVERVAAAIAGTLAARPMLCELAGASAGVLERNISAAVAARFKRAALANIAALGRLVRGPLPELGEPAGQRFAGAAVLMAGSVWAAARPSAAMLAAYEADRALAAMRLDFTTGLRELLATLLAGFLARPGT